MKTYKYIAVLALPALGLAACSQEDDITTQGNQKDAPLAIASVGVTELSTRATITTQDGTDYLTGGSIGVFVTSTTTYNDRYKGSNVKWTNNSGWATTATQPVLFDADGKQQQIAAYYPYNENLGTDNTYSIELPENYGTDYENYDYLYAGYVALSSNPATIKMSHLLSKVTVSIANVGTEISNDPIQGVSLFDVPRTATWKVPSNTLSGFGVATQVTKLYANDTDNDESVDNYVGYALPNAATTLGIRVTMKSESSFAAQVPITGGLASGNHYLISLNVGKDKVTVANIGIAGWNQTAATGGTAKECTTHAWENGVCTHCELVCRHAATTDGICTVCSLNIGYDYDSATNTWSAYNEAAFKLALSKGGTVKLCEDLKVSLVEAEITSGIETTLDLNGKTVDSESISSDGFDITNKEGGKLTIKNSIGEGKFNAKVENLGTLVMESGFVNHILNDGNGTATINGGTGVNLICYSGTITVNGGTFTGYLKAYDDGKITVTGGTFSANPSDYVAEGYTADDNGDGTFTVSEDTEGDHTGSEGPGGDEGID